MACVITIDPVEVTEAADNEIVRIRITGTATECERLVITLRCDNLEFTSPVVDVEEDGSWWVEFAETRCQCGDVFLVDAVSEDDETCRAPTKTGTLVCPQSCPEIIDFSVVEDDFPCNDDGTKRTVRFNIHIIAGDEDVVAHIQYEDDANSAPIIVDAGEEHENADDYSHPYSAPGEHHHAVLIIDQPEGCPNVRVEIPELEPCEIECPEIQDIRIFRSRDCHDGTRDMTLSPTIVGNGFQFYRWEFGDPENDDDDGTYNVNERPDPTFTHRYPAPGNTDSEYTATLTITGPGNCVDTQPVQVVVPPCEPEEEDGDGDGDGDGEDGDGRRGRGGCSPILCDILLALALAGGIVASVLAVIAGCAFNPIVLGAAVVVGLVSAILFILWGRGCNRYRGFCDTLRRLIRIFEWLAGAAPVVAGFVWLFGGGPCALGVLGAGVDYAVILVILLEIDRRRCEGRI